MRKILILIVGLWLSAWAATAHADTFQLSGGGAITGDIISYKDTGITVRQAGDIYTNLAWNALSQDTLKQLSENPKLKPVVTPFIEVSPDDNNQKSHKEITVGDVNRLQKPAKGSVFGALFSSSVGIVILLLIYAANLFAALEIALFRARPVALVVGIAAVAPILGPIIFLSIPTYMPPPPPEPEAEMQSFSVPGVVNPTPSDDDSSATAFAPDVEDPRTAVPVKPEVFARGQFTFNRRFFETKFPGFLGPVRKPADANKVLSMKSLRGEFVVDRITNLGQSDVTIQISKGDASCDVTVPFSEIQELVLTNA